MTRISTIGARWWRTLTPEAPNTDRLSRLPERRAARRMIPVLISIRRATPGNARTKFFWSDPAILGYRSSERCVGNDQIRPAPIGLSIILERTYSGLARCSTPGFGRLDQLRETHMCVETMPVCGICAPVWGPTGTKRDSARCSHARAVYRQNRGEGSSGDFSSSYAIVVFTGVSFRRAIAE